LRFFPSEEVTGAFFAVPEEVVLVAYGLVPAGVFDAVEGFFEAALGGI